MTEQEQAKWYERLGRIVAEECGASPGDSFEHQLGTVWIENEEGTTIAITSMVCENDEEEA